MWTSESHVMLAARAIVCGLIALAAGALIFVLASCSVPPSPRLGVRGAHRKGAMEASEAFALVEPVIRFVAALIALLPLKRLREEQETKLRQADYPLGLTPDEYSALSVIASLALGAVIAGGMYVTLRRPVFGVLGVALGLALPAMKFREIARRRFKEITRGLPHAIEIAAMCMNAGLDFPGALRLVSEPVGGKRDALSRELSAILDELELGHTRKEALESFAERVPIEAVRDFTRAVVQADKRGNPLVRVLQVQGRMLGMRRSVAAEEAAARAGVMMTFPMMLLVGCILLLLMGPFLVKGL